MISFLRQMVALPLTVTGFWLSEIGSLIEALASKIEGTQ